jgi:hypothetical protein
VTRAGLLALLRTVVLGLLLGAVLFALYLFAPALLS